METRLTIGEFAQRCGLSRSALRFYDQNGLLRPDRVDAETGYRLYATDQIADAHLIRRLRAAEMPVALLRDYLCAEATERVRILEVHARAVRQRADSIELTLTDLRAELASGTPDPRFCQIAAAAFADALEQVSFAMAQPAARPELARIWVETREQSLRLVATDSFRIAVRDLVPERLGSAPVRGAIAAERLGELHRLLRGGPTLTLGQGADEALTAATSAGSDPITVGGPAADFPDYEQILSALASGERAILARHELEAALQHLPQTGPRVALCFSAGQLALQAAGAPAVPVGGEWSGPDFTVHLDRGFLTDAVSATVGPDVTIEAIEPLAPVTLRSADTGTFSVLTMPVRP